MKLSAWGDYEFSRVHIRVLSGLTVAFACVAETLASAFVAAVPALVGLEIDVRAGPRYQTADNQPG